VARLPKPPARIGSSARWIAPSSQYLLRDVNPERRDVRLVEEGRPVVQGVERAEA
jgi:hypothetical protein